MEDQEGLSLKSSLLGQSPEGSRRPSGQDMPLFLVTSVAESRMCSPHSAASVFPDRPTKQGM